MLACPSLFFLLTLSLAAHLPFNAACWIAASASIALLGYYAAHVFGGWRRGVSFSGLLGGLYGLLFGILQSEDAALLSGRVALFVLLAAVMVMTRIIDWYALAAVRPATGQAERPRHTSVAIAGRIGPAPVGNRRGMGLDSVCFARLGLQIA